MAEIVLTNLSVLGSPVIRFATGDRARYLPGESCGCGRTWTCIEAGNISRVVGGERLGTIISTPAKEER